MLGQRAKRSDGGENAAPDELPVVASVGRMSLIADLAADELVDPALVVDAKPGALSERKLRCQARLDSRAHAGFGVKRDHGWEATARAWSGAPTGSSFPGGAPGVAMTATSLMTSAA